jgi:cation transport regulator ChaC
MEAADERIAVFGYASLVDPVSASLTLGRRVEEVWPAELPGWRRRFSQARDNLRCEKTFERVDDGTLPRWILGLNLERAADGSEPPNGGLIELTAAELERLDLRELRYDRTDVTGAVEAATGAPAFDRVIAYVAKPRHLAVRPPDGAVILAAYAETVERAFDALGGGQGERYRRTTLPYPAELVEARLVRDEIPRGNPRGW